MNELAENVSLKKLPVLATIREAVECSWQHRAILVRWIIGCTLFTGVFCYLQEYLIINYDWVNSDWHYLVDRTFFLILSAIPTLMISALFSVFCHRLILVQGEWGPSKWITFTKREWRFLGWFLTMGVAAFFLILSGFLVKGIVSAFLEDFHGSLWDSASLKLFIDNFFVDFFLLCARILPSGTILSCLSSNRGWWETIIGMVLETNKRKWLETCHNVWGLAVCFWFFILSSLLIDLVANWSMDDSETCNKALSCIYGDSDHVDRVINFLPWTHKLDSTLSSTRIHIIGTIGF